MVCCGPLRTRPTNLEAKCKDNDDPAHGGLELAEVWELPEEGRVHDLQECEDKDDPANRLVGLQESIVLILVYSSVVLYRAIVQDASNCRKHEDNAGDLWASEREFVQWVKSACVRSR